MAGNGPIGVYPDLKFGSPPADRPYVVVNMVTTIDGKTVSGGRDEPVADLGSPVDHATMRQIEEAADAVLVGAGSLRATPGMWYPASLKRFVVTRSGDMDFGSRFFTDTPEKAFVVTSDATAKEVPDSVQTLIAGQKDVDWRQALGLMRHDHGVKALLLEGGSELNAALLHEDTVDELFLTLAPKVKLGRQTPTYAGGEPLERKHLLQFKLVSCLPVGDEVFLRYRRDGAG